MSATADLSDSSEVLSATAGVVSGTASVGSLGSGENKPVGAVESRGVDERHRPRLR
jgi:hypothetical protein